MREILSIFLCAALVFPTLEVMVAEFGWVDLTETYFDQTAETEEENKETEKEEKKEKEVDEFNLAHFNSTIFNSNSAGWLENSHSYHSWVADIPCPPPDYTS